MTTVVTTILFTDIVDSTELASALGPRAGDDLRRAHFALLRAAVETAQGRLVKTLGDGVMAVFPSASAAVDAAVEIQRSVERTNRQRPRPLAVRVGISAGEATEDGGDYFGTPVIEASRLCSAAPGGTVLAASIVAALARGARHEFVSVGERKLKGLPAPVSVVEVDWSPPSQSMVPLPPRLSSIDTAAFVGRSEECEEMRQALKEATNGERRFVLIGGEPGIGKTRLASEIAALAYDQGAVVLYGRCDDDLGLPYQPWAEALGHLVDHAPAEVLTAHVTDHGGELAQMVPALSRRTIKLPPARSGDPETGRYLLWEAAAGLLASVGQDAPVVIVLDDLHWADRPTLALLKHLVTFEGAGSLLVVGTYRESELGADHPLTDTLAVLRRMPGVRRIRLAGLDDDDTLALMESLAGHVLDAQGIALAHAVHREAAGNPFFTRELLRHLAETGAVRREGDGHWVASAELESAALPASVREVVTQRVHRLGDAASRLLTVASVVGQEFELALVASVAEMAEGVTLDLLEAAIAASLVAELPGGAERFRFTHALVQHTLYSDLSATRRRRLHRRVAEALEAACAGEPGERVGELARHWAAAAVPVDADKAIEYAAQAGRHALATLAPDEATRWFTQALELADHGPDNPARRAHLLVGLGDAQRQSGDPAYRETLLDAALSARTIGATDILIAAVLANSRGVQSAFGDVDHERVAAQEAALDAVGERDTPERARLLALRAMESTYVDPLDVRLELVSRALTVARRAGDPATLAYVLQSTQHPVWVPETLDQRLVDTAEALTLARAGNDPVAVFWAAYERHIAVGEAGDLAQVDECLAEMARLSDRVRQPIMRWVSSWCRSWRVLLAGDVEQSETLAVEGLQIANDSGQPDAMVIYGSQLLAIRFHEGRIAELVDLAATSAATSPRISAFRAVHAYALMEAGRQDEAAAMLAEEASSGFPANRDLVWSTTMALWAEVAARQAHRPAAALLAERLAPFSRHLVFTGNVALGTIAHYLGGLAVTVGDLDQAATYYSEALDIAERLSAPFHIARAKVATAGLLQVRGRAGDVEEARGLLSDAVALSRQFGCSGVERAAAELLDGFGG